MVASAAVALLGQSNSAVQSDLPIAVFALRLRRVETLQVGTKAKWGHYDVTVVKTDHKWKEEGKEQEGLLLKASADRGAVVFPATRFELTWTPVDSRGLPVHTGDLVWITMGELVDRGDVCHRAKVTAVIGQRDRALIKVLSMRGSFETLPRSPENGEVQRMRPGETCSLGGDGKSTFALHPSAGIEELSSRPAAERSEELSRQEEFMEAKSIELKRTKAEYNLAAAEDNQCFHDMEYLGFLLQNAEGSTKYTPELLAKTFPLEFEKYEFEKYSQLLPGAIKHKTDEMQEDCQRKKEKAAKLKVLVVELEDVVAQSRVDIARLQHFALPQMEYLVGESATIRDWVASLTEDQLGELAHFALPTLKYLVGESAEMRAWVAKLTEGQLAELAHFALPQLEYLAGEHEQKNWVRLMIRAWVARLTKGQLAKLAHFAPPQLKYLVGESATIRVWVASLTEDQLGELAHFALPQLKDLGRWVCGDPSLCGQDDEGSAR
jgi:hypothetical protein